MYMFSSPLGTRQTKMLLLACLVGIFSLIPTIRSNFTTLHDGSAFVHYIVLDGGKLEECILTIKDERISLFPNHIENAVNPVKAQIESFENRACGFKLYNFNKDYAFLYNLTATILPAGATVSIHVEKSLDVKPINDVIHFRNVTEVVEYGQDYHIRTCRFPHDSTGYCSLYSPDSKLITQSSQSCGHDIAYITREHIGAWKCEINLNGGIEPFIYYVDLELKKMAFIDTWYKKENGYGILGCRYIEGDEKKDITKCSMLTPRKQLLNIEQYSASGRYDSFGTNYSQKICQIEFKLPAGSNETGTWTCQLGSRQGGFTKVGYINVERGSVYAKSQKLLTRIGDRPWIHCQVPYPATSAYAVHPDGKVFYVASFPDAQNGRLDFPLGSLAETDFGEWICHFAKNNSYDDDVITVAVERFDMVRPMHKEVDVHEGDELVMLFVANGAISYCTIADPSGNIYHIRPNMTSMGVDCVEYYGAGFEHGECGMKLQHANDTHEGWWKCMTNTVEETAGNRQPTALTRVRVDVRSRDDGWAVASPSTSILIGIGGVFAVLVAMALVVFGCGKFFSEGGERRRVRVSPPISHGDETSETTFVLHH